MSYSCVSTAVMMAVNAHFVKEPERTCFEFKKVSGVKINSSKSEPLLISHWPPIRDPLPFPTKQDFQKILRVGFGREGSAEETSEEMGKDEKEARTLEPLEADDQSEVFGPVERDPASVPVHCSNMASAALNPKAITRMIFFFIWNSKMNKGGKGVRDVTTILRGIYMCHCMNCPLRTKDESHFGFLMTCFSL
ncbi:hypothetical protein NDU88_006017 [Pleurodeles waltl]|uniref:Uncharacterized protein n=1 Tax=Pleurodeles waltl TaxID=8319 RepID=A0AAV7WWC6_PLEWA|nr:hypothetical protein NDU88_006017 [Pleurodeles waltl]